MPQTYVEMLMLGVTGLRSVKFDTIYCRISYVALTQYGTSPYSNKYEYSVVPITTVSRCTQLFSLQFSLETSKLHGIMKIINSYLSDF